jgi:hypothetical protein
MENSTPAKPRFGSRGLLTAAMVTAAGTSCLALALGFWLGGTWQNNQTPATSLQDQVPEIFAAAASGTDTMAVATGPVSRDAEGVFFLDFITGDLQCLVYYPQTGVFGARYFTNVQQQLGGGKNNRYLLVTGIASQPATSGTVRPGGSLIYVTDTTTGRFAAYAVPYDTTLERRRQTQIGTLVPVAVGPIRNFEVRDPGQNQPAGIVDPKNR